MLNVSTAYHFSQTLTNISIHMLPIFALASNSLILLVVLTNSQLNRSSFSVYVKSMAISDTLVLVLKLISYENKKSKFFYWPSMCTGLVFLSDSSVLLSVWTIVLLTIERTLVVLFPLRIKKFVSECRARVLIISVASLSALFSARVLFIPIDVSLNQKKRCHPKETWQIYRQLNATITDFSYCFIPLLIVIIGNCVTLYTVKRAIFKRRQLLINQNFREQQINRSEFQLRVMLFMVTLMFMVYFLPFTITNLISRWGLPFGLCFTQNLFGKYLIIRSFCELLKDFNFCTNFIIYCISGRRFRYAFLSLIRRHRHHHRGHRQQQPFFCTLPYHDGIKQRSDRLAQQKSHRLTSKHSFEKLSK